MRIFGDTLTLHGPGAEAGVSCKYLCWQGSSPEALAPPFKCESGWPLLLCSYTHACVSCSRDGSLLPLVLHCPIFLCSSHLSLEGSRGGKAASQHSFLLA